MINRHRELRPYYVKLNLKDVSNMLLTACKEPDVAALYLQLKDLQSITVELQKDSTSLLDARILFNGIWKKFSELLHRLSLSGRTIENCTFESAFENFTPVLRHHFLHTINVLSRF